MDSFEKWTIGLGILGWIWGIGVTIINRLNSRKDKRIERKFNAYSAYVRKSDELMQSIRTGSNITYGIPTDFLLSALSGSEEEMAQAWTKFNENLQLSVQKGTEPLLIIRNELNQLRIICSDELEKKIIEFDKLVNEFHFKIQKSLSAIVPSDPNSTQHNLNDLVQNNTFERFTTLNEEIINIMRKELGAKK